MNNPVVDNEQATVRLKVTIQNLSSARGAFFSAFWLGFHDGSFDTFTPGGTASLPLEIVAEEGIVGLEPITPEFQPIIALGNLLGADLPPVEDTIAALFSTEEPDGLQAMSFVTLGFPPRSEDSFTIDVNPDIHTALSYASMAVPTNDGFVADIEPIRIFSPDGVFLPQQIEIRGADVFDAGTEINDEDPTLTPILFDPPSLFFEAIGAGTPESGTIQPHPLLLEPGQGGFLDLPRYLNADFSRNPNETLVRILVELESDVEPQTTAVFGSLDADVIEVTGSNQLIFAGDSNDLIDASVGEGGSNRIYAGSGDDTVILGNSDRVITGVGDDRISVTSGGDNTLTGGAGRDQFWIATAEVPQILTTVEIPASEGYYTSEGDVTRFSNARLRSDKATAVELEGLDNISFLNFDLSSLSQSIITKAELMLEHDSVLADTLTPATEDNPVSVSAYEITAPFDAVNGNVNDIDYGEAGSNAIATTLVGDDGIYSWDVTELIEDKLLNSNSEVDIALSGVFGNENTGDLNSYASFYPAGVTIGLEPTLIVETKTLNVITDFTAGEDVIGIAGLGIGFNDLSITQLESGALITVNSSDLAILQGVDATSLSADSFTFA